MRAFAYLSQGQAGWVEKAPPQATGFDGIIRPLLVSPCTSDVHNVEIGCLAPHRILGHEGLGEIVAVGDQVRDFQVGEIVVVPPVTPDWRTVPSQLGAHQHCAGLITGQKLSNGEDGLLAEYVRIRDLDANAARIPPGVSWEGAVMAADMLNTGLYGAQLADVQPGDTVVVMGVGPVGLMAIAGAKLRGAGQPASRAGIGPVLRGHRPGQLQRGGRHPANPPAHPQAGRRLLHLCRRRSRRPGAGCHHGPLGRHRGQCELFYHPGGLAHSQCAVWLRHGEQNHSGR